MKKKITKIFTIAVVLLMMLATNVKADPVEITTDTGKAGTIDTGSYYVTNTGTLTITAISLGDQFKAYKVLDAYYNSTTNIITYEFTANFKNFLAQSTDYQDLTVDEYYSLTSGDIESGSTITDSELDKIASLYTAYIKENSVAGVDMTTTDSTATVTATAGTYLVLPSDTISAYAVMVGNIDFAAEGTSWSLNNPTIVAKVTTASILKSASGTSFTAGDAITYTLAADVPVYPTNATNKTYVIKDTLSAGHTFSGLSTIKAIDGATELKTAADGTITDANGNTVATATFANQVLTIVVNADYVNTTRLTISYNATLNESSTIGPQNPNNNTAELEYSNDPYGTTTYKTTSQTAVFTSALELKVYDDVEAGQPGLSGATFEIYSDAELTNKVGTMTTDANGIATFERIAAGNYYLKQTTAPTGYKLITEAQAVEITMAGNNTEDPDGYTQFEVKAAKAGLLPSTGGIGTVIYTLIGLLVIAGSISIVMVYRARQNQENFQV